MAVAKGNGSSRDPARIGALEDTTNAQNQFPGLKRLGQVIIGTALQPFDPILGLPHGGQHKDWHGALTTERLGKVETVFSRHHEIEHEQIEIQPLHACPGLGGIGGGSDAESVIDQVKAQEIAQAAVIVDRMYAGAIEDIQCFLKGKPKRHLNKRR